MRNSLSFIFWACLSFTILIAVGCMVGWHTHNDFLIRVFEAQIQMKYNSALGLLLACFSLLIFRYKSEAKKWIGFAKILAFAVLLLGVLTLSEYIFDINIGIGEWFFNEPSSLYDRRAAGQMSILASSIFVLLGLNLLFINRPNWVLFQFYTLSSITSITLLVLVGFNFISEVPPSLRMAMHLAIAFISLSFAIWLSQPMLHALISFQRKLNITFIAALLLLIVTTGVLVYFSANRIENSKWIRHTSEVMRQADDLQSVFNELRNKSEFSGHSNSDSLLRLANTYILKAKQLTSDNVFQKSRMDSLLKLVQNNGSSSLSAVLPDMLSLLNRFQREENNLLVIRETENEAGITSSTYITLLLVSAVIALVTGLFFIIRYSNRIRIKSENRFKSLLETAPDAMIIANEKGIIQLVNLQTEKIFGYQRDELLLQPIEMLIPDSFRSIHQSHREKFMQNPHARPMGEGLQLYAKRKDGSELPVEISLSPIQTEGQNWVSAAVRNITERKKIEEKVQYLARLVEDTSDAVYSLDEALNIKSWNRAAELLFGYTREEVIGKPAKGITRPQISEAGLEDIRTQLKAHGSWQGEMSCLKKNGGIIYISVSMALSRNKKGNIEGYVTVCRDFSERKKLEDELRQTNEELEAFSYSISHDLRAPLRAVTGFTNILEAEYSSQFDDEAKRITHIIKSNTEKMGQLIDDLLSFAHLNKKELEKSTVHTLHLVNDVIRSLNLLNEKKNVKWDVAFLPDVSGDQNMLRQVWINLLSNAAKYSRNNEHPLIRISFENQDEGIQFCVEDNGVGFDEKHSDKLFKVFQRLHSEEQFEGTGVGLAIVERIITRHGGRIWAHSTKGEGARFYFIIPNK